MGRQDNQALTWIAEQLSKLSLGQLLMKPVDDQFLKKKKKKGKLISCSAKGETPMKPFERDHHAAQLSVGFHAKQANRILHC